jgi:hypothetical protein
VELNSHTQARVLPANLSKSSGGGGEQQQFLTKHMQRKKSTGTTNLTRAVFFFFFFSVSLSLLSYLSGNMQAMLGRNRRYESIQALFGSDISPLDKSIPRYAYYLSFEQKLREATSEASQPGGRQCHRFLVHACKKDSHYFRPPLLPVRRLLLLLLFVCFLFIYCLSLICVRSFLSF